MMAACGPETDRAARRCREDHQRSRARLTVRRGLMGTLFGVCAAIVVSGPVCGVASAQPGSGGGISTLSQAQTLSASQKDRAVEWMNGHFDAMLSGDASASGSSAQALIEPFTRRDEVTASFRLALQDALVARMRGDLSAGADPAARFAGLRMCGRLGMGKVLPFLEASLASSDPVERSLGVAAHADFFATVRETSSPVRESAVAAHLDALGAALADEDAATVVTEFVVVLAGADEGGTQLRLDAARAMAAGLAANLDRRTPDEMIDTWAVALSHALESVNEAALAGDYNEDVEVDRAFRDAVVGLCEAAIGFAADRPSGVSASTGVLLDDLSRRASAVQLRVGVKKLAAIVLVFALGMAGVVVSDRPLPRAELTVLEIADFNTLDPQRMSYLQDFRLAYGIFEGLARWDNDTMDVGPALAHSWDVSGDGTEYTFYLVDDARWSNGAPVTAGDVAYAWQRAIMPDTAADYSNLFYLIEGAEGFFAWRRDQLDAYASRPAEEKSVKAAEALRAEADEAFRAMVGVEVVDDATLRVRLVRPAPYFMDFIAFPPFYPVHEATVERYVSVDARTGAVRQDHQWTKPGRIVCNGPYVPVSWKFKREMRLARNPEYRDPALAKSGTISIIPITEGNTGVIAYETGVVDWHSDVSVDYLPEMIERMRAGERDDLHVVPAFGTFFWSFNCTGTLSNGAANPFADARVRKAFALCVNKGDLTEKVKRTGEEVADVLIPPGSIPGYAGPDGLAMDVEAARRLMREAGWVDRDGDGVPEDAGGRAFPVVEILVTTLSYHEDVGLAVAGMWREALGVESKVVVRETKVYRDNLKRRDYMVARGGWYGDYGDPLTFLDLHRTGDGNNDRGYSNPAYDALLDRADAERDPAARMEILREAERMIVEEELPIVPFWHYNYVYLFDPPERSDGSPNPGGLRGITRHPRLVQYLFELEIVKGGLPVILLAIYTITFVLAWALPGSAVINDEGRQPPAAVLEAMEAQYDLDDPVRFYFGYLKKATGVQWLHSKIDADVRAPAYVFDFGPSFSYEDWTVNELLASTLPVSVTLGFGAILIAVFIGVGSGVIGAVRPNSLADHATLGVALIGISLPSFVTGTVLLMVFPVLLGIGRVGSWGRPGDFVLPALTLSLPFAAYIARLTRLGMIEHALKNAFLPVLSYLGPATAYAMTGSFVVELVFNVPGVGQHFVNAVQNKDLFVIMGVTLVFAGMLVVFNLVVDVLYSWVDPRIEAGG
ncbi:oppA [Symbiodinium necroappetens]|uniref:OppA protein n=1 Tax=Symbiodinium necroappetens TaxID=1628268 RepID=A0A812YJB7_9DINO|nr:oppA [Symbiodinium necroappetens]